MSKAAGLFLVFLFTGWFSDLMGISRNNSLKKEAEAAFNNKQYAIAANAWAQIVNETGAPDPGIRLNLAHAYYLQNQTVKAAREYQQVVRTGSAKLKSIAQQQLGNQLANSGDYEAALNLYREALKSDPKNRQARYNYELLLKKLKDKKDQQPGQNKQQQNKNQQGNNSENESQGAADQFQERSGAGNNNDQTGLGKSDNGEERETSQGSSKGDRLGENISEGQNVDKNDNQVNEPGALAGEATTSQKLQQIHMPEERARMLLNAMRDAERQYLQQLPRQQRASPQLGKPNW